MVNQGAMENQRTVIQAEKKTNKRTRKLICGTSWRTEQSERFVQKRDDCGKKASRVERSALTFGDSAV